MLVVRSTLNQGLQKELFKLISAETNLLVRYMVNTIFHGDHFYGIFYLPEEVFIIQHAIAKAYIEFHFEADTAFMMQNFSQGRDIREDCPTDADILIGDGGSLTENLGDISVDIRDYGYAQTGGDLFVSVPSANTLWTGNLVIAKEPAVP